MTTRSRHSNISSHKYAYTECSCLDLTEALLIDSRFALGRSIGSQFVCRSKLPKEAKGLIEGKIRRKLSMKGNAAGLQTRIDYAISQVCVPVVEVCSVRCGR